MSQQLLEIYQSVLKTIASDEHAFNISVEFYPYVGISNRIRRRDGHLFVRISDVLHDAPLEFHTALAQILIRKLYRRRVPPKSLEIYRDYLKRTEIHEQTIVNRRERGRKIITTARGEFYDLDEIFALLNHVYFQDSLAKPILSWSAQKTFRILGHHDAAHEAIIVSKSLDDRRVPRFVVEYVVYHEMLHIKHPTKILSGRRYNHTPAFRLDEENFAFYEEAEQWIELNAGSMKKEIKKLKRAKGK